MQRGKRTVLVAAVVAGGLLASFAYVNRRSILCQLSVRRCLIGEWHCERTTSREAPYGIKMIRFHEGGACRFVNPWSEELAEIEVTRGLGFYMNSRGVVRVVTGEHGSGFDLAVRIHGADRLTLEAEGRTASYRRRR